MKSLLMYSCFSVVLFFGTAAFADNNADEAELQFQLGATAYKTSSYTSALEHFLASNRLVPNRNVVYNIARSFEQLGRYAEAYRYYVDAKRGAPDDDIKDINEALERLAPRVAVIDVQTVPEGATIFVQRKDLGSVGQTPRPLAVEPGEYVILVELDGYKPSQSDSIKLKKGQKSQVRLELERITGQTILRGEAATVRMDSESSEPLCTVPCTLDLPVGQRTLYLSMQGRVTQTRQLNVEEGQSIEVDVQMPVPMGSLLVTADESEATIEIDGKLRGFTPSVIPNLAEGKHKVRVSRRGYKPAEFTVHVVQGEQTNLEDVPMIPLREVAAASRALESIEDAPASISVISAQEIEAFQYPTVYEALRGTRGVAQTFDSIYGNVAIRGLGQPNDMNNRLLLLSDGAVLNENILYQAFIGYEGRVDLGEVQAIEVIRGPGSVIYGTGAVSGVINLVPHTRQEPSSVQLSFGTVEGVGRARAGFVYRANDNAGVRASVSSARSEGWAGKLYFDSSGDGANDANIADGINAFDAFSSSGRAWLGPLNLQWHYSYRDVSIPTGSFDTIFNDPRNRYIDQNASVELRFEQPLTETLDVLARLRGHLSDFDLDYLYATDTAFKQTYVENYQGLALGGELRLTWRPIEAVQLALGSEVNVNPTALMAVHRMEENGDRTQLLDINPSFNVYAAYALGNWQPTKWLRLSAGARLDVWDREEGEGFSSINPRLAAIIKPAEGHNLKIMGGRAFRAPSTYEVLYTDTFTSQPSSCCGVLTPETFYQSEVEYSIMLNEHWSLLASVHGLIGQDFIGTLPVPSDPENQVYYGNIEADQRIIGADLELRREFRRGWMFAAMAGVLDASYDSVPEAASTESTRVPNAPHAYGSLKAVVPAITNRLSLATRVTVEAPRRILLDADTQTDWAVIADMVLTGRIEEFGVRYAVGVYNMFDWTLYLPVDPFVTRTMPQHGRSFLANVSLEY